MISSLTITFPTGKRGQQPQTVGGAARIGPFEYEQDLMQGDDLVHHTIIPPGRVGGAETTPMVDSLTNCFQQGS